MNDLVWEAYLIHHPSAKTGAAFVIESTARDFVKWRNDGCGRRVWAVRKKGETKENSDG